VFNRAAFPVQGGAAFRGSSALDGGGSERASENVKDAVGKAIARAAALGKCDGRRADFSGAVQGQRPRAGVGAVCGVVGKVSQNDACGIQQDGTENESTGCAGGLSAAVIVLPKGLRADQGIE